MAKMTSLRAIAASAAVFAINGAQALWLGGGLTILSNNQLDGAENDGSAAILIHQPAPFSAALYSCSLLGETPWNPSTAPFNATLASSLAYQVHLTNFPPTQLFWISRPDPSSPSLDTCRAISPTGTLHPSLSCLLDLPTLCTQSAPVSSRYTSNTTLPYQLTHYASNTLLTGYRDLHTFKFRGVRYAPTPKRFTFSRPSDFSAQGEALALDAGADCSQPVGEVRNGSSEDCLFANVWTPYLPPMGSSSKKNLKPVMLYFYGGGLTSGSGKNLNTDGTNLASRGDVVSVSVNYRVGSLGFLNLNDGVHKGNYALSDMVSALEWVQRYISYFGGDPERVTIFGESAGAMGVHVLLGTAKAKGLFHRAIKQSSPDGYPGGGKILQYMYYDTLEHNYETTTKSVLRAAGCLNATDAVACLEKLSGFELVNLSTNANGFVVDGDLLTYHELVVNSTAASLATNVTVMTGVNRDEAGVNIDAEAYPADNTTLAAYFNAEVARQFSMPSNASSFLGLDKPANISTFSSVPLNANNRLSADLTPAQILNTSVRIATDAVFTCYGLAKTYSAVKHNAFRAAYFYQFNRTYQTAGYTRPWCNAPKTAARPDGDPDGEYMKCHAGEQMVVFGTERRSGYPDRDGLDVPFMQLAVDYWAAFARTGDPNPDKGYLQARGHWHTLSQVEKTGRWEAVSAENPTMRLLQWNGGQIPFGEAEVCKALGAPLDVFETGEK